MNCKETQELVLTDYIDGEMAPEAQAELERHLADCPACAAFARAARESAVEPFARTPRLEPPERIWRYIKEAIGPRPSPGHGLLERFLIGWSLRPVFTLAAVAAAGMMFFVLHAPFFRQDMVRVKEDTPAITMAREAAPAVDEAIGVFGDELDALAYAFADDAGDDAYGTAIEEYFL